MHIRLSRLSFLLVLLALLAVVPVSLAQMTYTESPFLAGRDLPPVAERLPLNPAVVEPLVEQGKYGGELRIGFVGNNPGWGGLWFFAGWENLVIWEPDFSGVMPNIAERWEISEDVREYTFYLREGLKWSDGAPFTADDVMFYVEDILFNPELSPAGPVADWLPTDGAADFKAEKINDYAFKFIFAKPNGTFMYQLPTWSGRHITWFPKHYLSQFHAKYNPDIQALVDAEEGVQDWMGLFNKKAAGPSDDIQNYFLMPERPTLFPWVVTQPLGAGTQIRMERNPYYWKVDTAGNQLPYVDTILGISFQDDESRTLAMLNGDLDMIKDPGDNNRPLYFEAMDAGKPIKINTAISDGGTTHTIHFNQTVADPVKAEIFANKDFRIGMSHAINRPEIIEIVLFGQGEPSQAAPLEGGPLYNEQLATQYLEYNVDLANEYLDKVLPDKDADGMRLGPDGKRFTIVLSVSNDLSYGTNWVQLGELLTGYWKAVGVDVILNSMPDTQFIENKKANNLEATIYTGEGGAGVTPLLEARYYVPMFYFSLWGNAWYYWRVQDPQGTQVEPPQYVKDAYAAFENAVSQPSQEEQFEAMRGVLQTAADNFYVMGIARPAPGYQPYHARLGNVPDEWIVGWIQGVQKIMLPEQWFINQ